MCCQFKKKSVSFYFFLFRFTSWFFFFPKDSTMSGLIKKRKEKKIAWLKHILLMGMELIYKSLT